jgi:hypothetical protein
MKIVKFALCFCVLASAYAAAGPGSPVFDITKYGAVGDGNTLDSAAINKAIDAANSAGGGTVYFPAGAWLSGQHASGVPALVLKDVDGLKIHDCPFMSDTSLKAVKDQKF